MVVIFMEANGKRTSETRHVVLEKGVWVGHNPDPRAVEANAASEATLAAAEIGVKLLSAKLEELEAEKEPDAEAIRKARFALTNANASLMEAAGRDAAVKAEFPLMVAFNIA